MATLFEPSFFLSETVGKKVLNKSNKIGKLSDVVVIEDGIIPEVTHIVVHRPYGYPMLFIPWDKVVIVSAAEIVVDIESVETYEVSPDINVILLKDYILDKKVLDCDENEIEIVYDVKLTGIDSKLYASDVDFTRLGLLRRIGLSFLAKIFANPNEDTLSWKYIQPLPENLGSFSGSLKLKVLKDKISEIHPVDLADIIEELEPQQQIAIFNELDTELASDTLEEIEPRVQRTLIASMPKERVAQLIEEMTPAQAADLLGVIPSDVKDEILEILDKEHAQKIEYLLEKHDESVLPFATQYFIKYSSNKKAHDVLDEYRHIAKDMDVIMYVYVVDENDTLKGIVDLRELLQANESDLLSDIMTEGCISLSPNDDIKEALSVFTRYSYRALPVVDDNDKIVGVVQYRDIIIFRDKV